MIQSQSERFTGAVDFSYEFESYEGKLGQIWLKFNAVPTTSENIEINFVDKVSGVSINMIPIDPGTDATADVFALPDFDVYLSLGDKITITYPNSDANTIDVGLKVADRIK